MSLIALQKNLEIEVGITCITISFIYGIPFVDLFDIFVLQALLKLTTGFLKREFQATPDFQNDDGVEFK